MIEDSPFGVMQSGIKIIEKPEEVSWDAIHEVVWAAHADNRRRGIYMAYPELPGDAIREKIGERGKMFVAMEGDRVVATAAYMVKGNKSWFSTGDYAYFCFAGVLPEYAGKGVFAQLTKMREEAVREAGLRLIVFDTNEENGHVMEVHAASGFRKVALKAWTDHYNVVMAKWTDGCPYSSWYCRCRYVLSVVKMKCRYRKGADGKLKKRI